MHHLHYKVTYRIASLVVWVSVLRRRCVATWPLQHCIALYRSTIRKSLESGGQGRGEKGLGARRLCLHALLSDCTISRNVIELDFKLWIHYKGIIPWSMTLYREALICSAESTSCPIDHLVFISTLIRFLIRMTMRLPIEHLSGWEGTSNTIWIQYSRPRETHCNIQQNLYVPNISGPLCSWLQQVIMRLRRGCTSTEPSLYRTEGKTRVHKTFFRVVIFPLNFVLITIFKCPADALVIDMCLISLHVLRKWIFYGSKSGATSEAEEWKSNGTHRSSNFIKIRFGPATCAPLDTLTHLAAFNFPGDARKTTKKLADSGVEEWSSPASGPAPSTYSCREHLGFSPDSAPINLNYMPVCGSFLVKQKKRICDNIVDVTGA
jgi:hypothetical protein